MRTQGEVRGGGWTVDPRTVRRRPRRWVPLLAGLVSLGLGVGLVAVWTGWRPLAAAAQAKPELGLFVGGERVSSVTALAATLRVRAQVITVYAAAPSYSTFIGPTDTSLRLLLGVGAVTPAEATTIGDRLVATGHANTILRIMWEMNGNWFPWGTEALTAAQYIAVYRAAVRAFAAVPGNHFQYVWNVNVGTVERGRTEFDTYPGNAYVSNVGLDFYNYNRALGAGTRESTVAVVLAFAAAHHRPTSLDEWGVDGEDDPAYIDFVAQLVHNPANHVTLQAYFSDGSSTITRFPKALAEYTKDFARDSPLARPRVTSQQ